MASYLDREKLPIAITDSTKLDLSHVHVTTGSFMQLTPAMVKEMVPGEKLDVQVNTFSRMDVLPVPTYGRMMIKNRAFFVPYRTIFRGWNDFITDAPHANSMNNYEALGNILTGVPTVSNATLAEAICDASVKYAYNGSNERAVYRATGNDSDIVYVDASSNTYKYNFTTVGRQVYKVLESLGYKVNFNAADTTVYNALPLLAFAKVYCDWYFPSAYTNTDIYNYLLLLCNADTGVDLVLNKVDVARILQFCYVCYDSDPFVSAWDNPASPAPSAFTSMTFNDITLTNSGDAAYFNSVTTSAYGTPYMVQANSSRTAIGSNYMHQTLAALGDYMKRHQLAGSRAMDRYLARYGKALPSEKLNRSVYLGSQMIPVQIGDVMSNSMVGQSGFDGLGEYAGKGIAYGENGRFSYSTDEYGIFIITSSIVPATGYYQGVNRHVKHLSKTDFYVPEFDNLGVQAIGADELYVTQAGDASLADPSIHDHVFGFEPKYAEYKYMNDQVTGNFRVKTLNGGSLGSASWHLMREFDDADWDSSVAQMNHGVDFVYSRGDTQQYNRIFAYNDPNGIDVPDPFIIIHEFNVASWSPMKPLYDTYEFDSEGREINLDVNGVKMN